MLSLVYASSAVKLFSEAELVEILKQSRENNLEADITGMLLYKDGNFIQALEGPDGAVEAVYESIKKDPRHRNIILLGKDPIKERQFSDWSMGFQDLNKLTAKQLEGYSEFLLDDFTPAFFKSKPTRAYIMLLSFRDNMR